MPAFVVLAFVILCLASRLPLRSNVLVNWDSVQFALATEAFDLQHHRPHPPGYIGYIYAGKALNHLTGDANTSFVLISLVASAAAPLLFLHLARRFLGRRRSLLLAALFATSPLLWYYGGTALTYAVEAALATAFGLLIWQAREGPRHCLIAPSLVLALLGAMRPTGEVLLFPLWLWALWPASPAAKVQATTVLFLASLVWIGPLLWLSDGPLSYLEESRALARSAGGTTSLVWGTAADIGLNWGLVGLSLVAALGAALALVVRSAFGIGTALRAVDGTERAFLALWILPALAVFLLGHFGQPGYLLLVMPALFLLLGKLDLPSANPSTADSGARQVAVLVALNLALAFLLPTAIYRNLPPQSLVAGQLRQFVPAANDAYWNDIFDFIESFDAETTAVLSAPGGPKSSAGFRHLSYYLPAYHVYAAGWDAFGGFGILYSAYAHQDDYQVSEKSRTRPVLKLEPGVRTILIADWTVKASADFAVPLRRFELDTGLVVWAADVLPGSTLVFQAPGHRTDDRAAIRPLVSALAPTDPLRPVHLGENDGLGALLTPGR
jgi:4-amino-4-deoxy-L-arabinose transferase-like glycosyltransferase